MNTVRSRWMLVAASMLFLVGSLAFLDDETYTLGAWLFVAGSTLFVANSLAAAFDRSRS